MDSFRIVWTSSTTNAFSTSSIALAGMCVREVLAGFLIGE